MLAGLGQDARTARRLAAGASGLNQPMAAVPKLGNPAESVDDAPFIDDPLLANDAVALIHQVGRGVSRAINNLAVQSPGRRLRGQESRRRRILRTRRRRRHRNHRRVTADDTIHTTTSCRLNAFQTRLQTTRHRRVHRTCRPTLLDMCMRHAIWSHPAGRLPPPVLPVGAVVVLPPEGLGRATPPSGSGSALFIWSCVQLVDGEEFSAVGFGSVPVAPFGTNVEAGGSPPPVGVSRPDPAGAIFTRESAGPESRVATTTTATASIPTKIPAIRSNCWRLPMCSLPAASYRFTDTLDGWLMIRSSRRSDHR